MDLGSDFRVQKLKVYLALLSRHVVRERVSASSILIWEPASARFDPPPDAGEYRPIEIGQTWGNRQQWAWFKAVLEVPARWPAEEVELRLRHEARYFDRADMDDTHPAGPEGQVFIDGRRVGAIDQRHTRIRGHLRPGHEHDIRAVFFAARCRCRHTLAEFGLARVDRAAERLYHDLQVALAVVDELDPACVAREKLIAAVDAAVHALDVRDLPGDAPVPADLQRDPADELLYASIPAARAAFDRAMAAIAPAGEAPTVVCTGHAHIDLAWLWPIRQAMHKCVRTFATQVRLIGQYPGYVFQQSSPQAYAWIERNAPDLFQQIARCITDGTWEADGATWVEMDTNVTSGESLVRQLLYGKRYFREKFGIDSRTLWLPDVFGYSAALPQILKLAGVDGFITQKISWNQYNRFPFQSFRWRGIDGTEVPTHFPLNSYNCLTSDKPVHEIKTNWDQYAHKPLGLEPLVPMGWGDGGGGPTEEMLELVTRLRDMPSAAGMPRVKLDKAGAVMERVRQRAADLPVWDGELYLELHRGTYTTQAWIKRANRKNEVRLHSLEWLASLAGRHGYQLDRARLDRLWQDLLLLQFHDILPGSSVGEVYEETRPMHERIARDADAMIAEAAEHLCGLIDTSGRRQPVVIFNTLPWDRSGPIRLMNGVWRNDITVPAGGWTVVDAAEPSKKAAGDTSSSVSRNGRELTNRFWRLRLDDRGRICELYDRIHDRQVLRPGSAGNEWQLFEDRPFNFDAWDIDLHYEEHPLAAPICESIEVVETEPSHMAVEVTWRLPKIGKGPQSTITQRIILYANRPRIDFETRIDWHEHHQLLKVAFPVDVRATEATYEIQFGHIRRPTHRNTSWDVARFEVCAHRFADLSEHGYGVALLNDCKYGHDVHDAVLRLTCIKSPQAPDARADQGHHVFTYSLLPHAGLFQEAGVIQAAAELNVPLILRDVARPAAGRLPAQFSPFTCDNPAVIADTLKPAADGDGLILRLYEAHGSHAQATLTFADAPRSVQPVDLLEQPLADDVDHVEIHHEGARIALRLRPFQMVSVRVRG